MKEKKFLTEEEEIREKLEKSPLLAFLRQEEIVLQETIVQDRIVVG